MKTKTGFTLKEAQALLNAGKIRGITDHNPKEKTPAGKIVAKHFKKRSKEKEFIGKNLLFWCQERGLKLFQEYRFDRTGEKGYLFDHAIPDLMIAVEYEGLFSEKSGHTTITGYTKDVLKYNLALSQGWRVIRLTAKNYEDLISELNALQKLAGNV